MRFLLTHSYSEEFLRFQTCGFCLSLSVNFSMARAHALGAVIFLLLELPGWWMDSSLRFSSWASVDVDSVACHFYALNHVLVEFLLLLFCQLPKGASTLLYVLVSFLPM